MKEEEEEEEEEEEFECPDCGNLLDGDGMCPECDFDEWEMG